MCVYTFVCPLSRCKCNSLLYDSLLDSMSKNSSKFRILQLRSISCTHLTILDGVPELWWLPMHKIFTILKLYLHHKKCEPNFRFILTDEYLWLWSFVPWRSKVNLPLKITKLFQFQNSVPRLSMAPHSASHVHIKGTFHLKHIHPVIWSSSTVVVIIKWNS